MIIVWKLIKRINKPIILDIIRNIGNNMRIKIRIFFLVIVI